MTVAVPVSTPWPAQRLAASLFLVLGTDMFIISPLLPQISSSFGVSSSEASVMGWSFSLVYAALSPVAALVSNRFTRRSAMWFGAAVFSVGTLAVAVLPTLDLVVVGRVIAAAGAAIMGPPVWSFASETAAPHEVGKAVAAVASTFAAGQVIGVPLGSLIASFASWRWVFLGLGLVGAILAVTIGLRLGPEARIPERIRFTAAARESLSLWRQKNFSFLVCANFFAQATRYATYTFAGALLLSRFGLDTAELGMVGMAVGLGSLAGAATGGRLMDRVHARNGSQPLLNVVYASIMTCSILLATMPEILWLSLVGWVVTFAAGSAFVSNGQELLSQAGGRNRAYALSWNNAALYAGTAAGTYLLGLVALGGTSFILIAGASGAFTVAASLILWRRTEAPARR